VSFPKGGNKNVVTLIGNETIVEEAAEALPEFVVESFKSEKFVSILSNDNENACQSMKIPKADISYVLGRNYENLVGPMMKFGVTIWATEQEGNVLLAIVALKSNQKDTTACKNDITVTKN
jgi:hypothetical protein